MEFVHRNVSTLEHLPDILWLQQKYQSRRCELAVALIITVGDEGGGMLFVAELRTAIVGRPGRNIANRYPGSSVCVHRR